MMMTVNSPLGQDEIQRRMVDRADEGEFLSSSGVLPSRILHADDSQLICSTFRHLFRHHRFPVDSVFDGQAALDRISQAPGLYACVVTDHDMPRMHGLSLVRGLLKRNFPGKIVVFSASVSTICIEEYRALGIEHVLNKGQDVLTLRSILESLD